MADTVELETGPEPRGSIIWLHGLGADGHDFEPVVPELRLPASLPLRFVFPHAPVRPVTVNGGMAMRAWYDIVSLDADGRADEAGIRDSSAILDALVAREVERGLSRADVVLAGFSQGGAVALFNALTTPHRYAGVMALSTYLPLPSVVAEEAQGDASVPVFMAHGTMDPMVPLAGGRHARQVLEAHGYDVEWHEYPMMHAVCPREIADIRGWLLRTYGVDDVTRN
ncbi:MAG: alpha/beta hydrolase-fold protein [Woeseiaceae bacterium]|nr:alpha/beta hydrolase-fold protein [Woeseiaceae bacterium]